MESTMDVLESQAFYMNPHTGSIDTGDGWQKDYALRDKAEFPTWEDWGGNCLIEVIWDKAKASWIEKE
jgi:hypothetical protein